MGKKEIGKKEGKNKGNRKEMGGISVYEGGTWIQKIVSLFSKLRLKYFL